jgi:hypothetical protein
MFWRGTPLCRGLTIAGDDRRESSTPTVASTEVATHRETA